MPPHQPIVQRSRFIHDFFWPGAKILILATTLALAGCATNASRQDADSGLLHTARDSFLSKTQSDPLGAYLAFSGYVGSDSVYPKAQKPHKPLAATALNFLGIKYRYGGGTPKTGFDCSGLVVYAAQKSLGLKLPRRAADLAHQGIRVKRSELEKGDLVFFNTRGARNSHVGIYLGNHEFVHAPRTGSVVRIESMDVKYWRKRYNGARRLAANDTLKTRLDGQISQ